MRNLMILVLVCLSLPIQAQELLCNVTIDASRIQSDRTVFQDMQQNFSRYLNFQKWTQDEFNGVERIRCNVQIVISERPSPDYFKGQVNIQVYRPVYNTTYETLVLNIADNDFDFRYVPYQNLVFVDNSYTDNLTSLLNFYAYIILGFDYASYGANGGLPYFRKAQDIANQAGSGSRESGWRSNENTRNRYWLVENLMNSRYKGFHTMMYKYHRKGLDQMESNPSQARREIMEAIKELQRLNRQNPLLVLSKNFLDSKDDELVKVFTNAFVNDKKEFVEIMNEVDPSNIARYQSVMDGK